MIEIKITISDEYIKNIKNNEIHLNLDKEKLDEKLFINIEEYVNKFQFDCDFPLVRAIRCLCRVEGNKYIGDIVHANNKHSWGKRIDKNLYILRTTPNFGEKCIRGMVQLINSLGFAIASENKDYWIEREKRENICTEQ